jgi:hypothetical protein
MPLIVTYKTLSSFLQMRNFLWILTFILFCGGLSAQGFARKIGSQGQPSGVYHVESVSKSEIVLNLSYVFSGVDSKFRLLQGGILSSKRFPWHANEMGPLF